MLAQVGISGWQLVTGAFKVRIQTISVLNATWKRSAPEARKPRSQQRERRLGRQGEMLSLHSKLVRGGPFLCLQPLPSYLW